MIRLLSVVALVCGLLLAPAAQVQARAQDLFPGANLDTAIPAPEGVIGHPVGARLTPVADIHRYLETLAEAAPDRMVTGEYGRTWQGRRLIWAAISSPENIARLDQIRAASRALADPRTTDAAEARRLIADTPAIVWLAYSVHGNEVGPAEASMAVARHLLAARGDPRIQRMLQDTVVVLIPTQNPDGRDRFINGYRAGQGLESDPDVQSVQGREPWPSGRFNHYLFDLNRDWFAQTQPETRGHAALQMQWKPQVVADIHEMGTDQTYFFPPEADPFNPLFTDSQLAMREVIGRAHGQVFDAAGIDYFTREYFDAFYPGFGDNWPGYSGAIAMTYEQGSARGDVRRRSDGSLLTLFETVRSQFLISLSTIDAAAVNRRQLMSDFHAYHASAIEDGRRLGAILLPRTGADPTAADRLARLLAGQGVEVGVAGAGFSACGSHAAGTYVIDLAQPAGRLARVLLDPSISLPADFTAEQERRRAQGLDHQLYDVAAWALPLAYNTPAIQCRSRPGVAVTPLSGDAPLSGGVIDGQTAAAWIVQPGLSGMRFLTAALREGLTVRVLEAGFTLDGRDWPAGSLVLTRGANPDDAPARIARIAAQAGATVQGVGDTWVTSGPSLGSGRAPVARAPRIAMAWEAPTGATSAGGLRWMIEQAYGYPVTIIRTAQMATSNLGEYDVIILPDGGGYASTLGERGVANLRDWARQGGVLIGVGGGMGFMSEPGSQMLATRLEGRVADEDASEPAPADEATVPGVILTSPDQLRGAIRPAEGSPDSIPGILLRATTDPDHWLAAGVAHTLNILASGSDIYAPLRLDQGANVVRFAGPNDLLAAGYIWDENRAQLAYKPAVVAQSLGSGQLIGFAHDPSARGFMRGLDVLFLNAVFRGPSHTR
ncbi:M14 metallopeptidase family protein [Brevundimonas sp.]|uniref:M14 metallopeptidase family protein n=1 Tax=Brevundimonas sp. TaxID=1871086 RepID=UPI00391AC8AE